MAMHTAGEQVRSMPITSKRIRTSSKMGAVTGPVFQKSSAKPDQIQEQKGWGFRVKGQGSPVKLYRCRHLPCMQVQH